MTLRLAESLKGNDAYMATEKFGLKQISPFFHVISLEDRDIHVFCKFKQKGLQTLGNDVTLNYSFGKANGLKNGMAVNIEPVHNEKKLGSVDVEAVSDGDYEVLVSNLEKAQSTILDQFQIVWPGAVLPLRIGGLRCFIRVLRLNNDLPYGLLAEMTEVHVREPKTSKSQSTKQSKKEFSAFCLEYIVITGKFIDRQENFSIDTVLVSSQTLKNRHLEHEFGYLTGFLKCKGRGILVKLAIDDSVPVCHFLVSESAFLCLDLKRPAVAEFSYFDVSGVLAPKHLIIKAEKGASRTLIESSLRSLIFPHEEIFLNHGTVLFLSHMRSVVHLVPENLSYCRLSGENLRKIPVVIEEEEHQPVNGIKFSDPFLVENLFDEEPLKEAILQCLPTDPRLHGSPLDVVAGVKFGNILVTGGIGSGKTTFVHSICKKLQEMPHCIKTFSTNCVHWKGKSAISVAGKLEKLFEEARNDSPAILILDNMHVLFPKTEDLATINPLEACHIDRMVDSLCSVIQKQAKKCRILVIGIAVSKSSLHTRLSCNQGFHFFTHFIELQSLDKMQRLKLLRAISRDFLISESDDRIDRLLRRMEGFSPSDIRIVGERTYDFAAQRMSLSGSDPDAIKISCEDLERGLEGFVPMNLQNIRLFQDSSISWEDVGGLKEVKRTLIETLQWPTKYPTLFAQIPIRLRSGILLYGPSGTGKTMLASAVAKECGINFISVKGPELLSKYIGSSEQNVRDTFSRARAAKPCILFFDEFDSLAPRRGHDSTGVTDRVVNQLLTELDGVEGSTKGVWILAASSRPDMIDPALLRPGRIDMSLYCPLPNQEERLEILRILTRKVMLENIESLAEVAVQTHQFSGADLKGLVYNAQMQALDEDYVVRRQHLLKALHVSKPSVSISESRKFEEIRAAFIEGKVGSTKVDQAVTLA